MENIIIIAQHSFFRDHQTFVRIDMLNYIKNNNKNYNIHLYFSDCNPSIIHTKINELNPKVILFMDINSFSSELQKYNFVFKYNFNKSIKIGLLVEDTYYINTTKSCPYVQKCHFLVLWYKNKLIEESYKETFPNKQILSLDSRFINIDRFKDYQLPKKYDILMYGCRLFKHKYKQQNINTIQNYIQKYEKNNNIKLTNNSDISFYALREKLLNVLTNCNKYNFKLCPEIGDYANNEELSKLINQSYLTIVCSTIADVMVFKHLEIPASKSVILGSYPTDYKELFEGNIVEVNEFMTDDEIINIIDQALLNKEDLELKSSRIYEKVRNEHNLEMALQSFNNIINKIV
jgi:hypothetical protein